MRACTTACSGGIGTGVVALVGSAVDAMRLPALRRLAVAAVGAAVVASPLAVAYAHASSVVGERRLSEVAAFSATLGDYAQPHPESWLYGDGDRAGHANADYFPATSHRSWLLARLCRRSRPWRVPIWLRDW